MKNSEHSIEMTSGSIMPAMLAMAIPLAVSSILQVLFNAADLVVVGNFASENSLAAVGSTNVLVHFFVTFFIGLSIGSNALISRLLGAGNDRDAHTAVQTSMALGALCGVVMSVVGVLTARRALIWMQSPEETLELATQYFQIYSLGMFAILVYDFGSAVLRAQGDTKRPMYYLAFAGVINTLLNLLFVIVFKMDVAGVALATTISNGISAFLVVRLLVRETGVFHLELTKLIPEPATTLKILRIGVPAGLQGVVFSLSNIVIQSSINGFGPIVMAGSAAAQNLEGIVWLTMNSFTQCALTFMSQNLGARRFSRLNRVAFVSCFCAAGSGLALGQFMLFFASTLLGVFDQRPEVIEAGMTRCYYVCGCYWLCGLMDCACGVIRGLGHNMTPTVVSLLGACGLRILWIATIFQIPKFHTIDILFWSYPGSWLITFLVHVGCYFWMRRAFPKKDAVQEEAPCTA